VLQTVHQATRARRRLIVSFVKCSEIAGKRAQPITSAVPREGNPCGLKTTLLQMCGDVRLLTAAGPLTVM